MSLLKVKIFGTPLGGWLVIFFLGYWLVTDPTGLAHFAHNLWSGLKTVAHSLSIFIHSF